MFVTGKELVVVDEVPLPVDSQSTPESAGTLEEDN
jgi:hypothetical protein